MVEAQSLVWICYQIINERLDEYRAWIFQANPTFYDIQQALCTLTSMTWDAKQDADKMNFGDTVYIWQSGGQAAILAAGHITAEAAEIPMLKEEKPFVRQPDQFDETTRRVVLSIDKVLTEPITRDQLLSHKTLSKMKIIRAPQGTNFLLRSEEIAALKELVGDIRKPPPPSLLDRFCQYVRDSGFNFSRELLANYYVALKTKPFVILTGISGTGKTKLGQLFAEFMTLGTARPGEDPHQRYVFVSVRPDWTDSKGLLGFYNYLKGSYEPTDFLRLIIKARNEYWKEQELVISKEEDTIVMNGPTLTIDGEVIVRITREGGQTTTIRTGASLAGGKLQLEGVNLRDLKEGDKVSLLVPNRKARPYFVVLDEMNLAKVEHYFSDFLSALESRRIRGKALTQEPIILHDQPQDLNLPQYGLTIPARIEIPPNIYFTGTVNIDETTHMFSPKVLDRANTIEFNEVDLAGYPRILKERKSAGSGTAETKSCATEDDLLIFTDNGRFVESLINKEFDHEIPVYKELERIGDLLRPYNLHFGYRVVDEILQYVHNANRDKVFNEKDQTANTEQAFDLQIVQKILPKFHGSRNQLEEPLRRLLRFSLDGQAQPELPVNDILPNELETSIQVQEGRVTYIPRGSRQEDRVEARYPRSCSKLMRMLKRLRDQGFTSFIE